MPTISGRTTLLTGTNVANVFLGSQYELAPFDGTIEIGVRANAVGLTLGIFSGPDVLAEPNSPAPFGAVEALPVYPDDYHWEDEVAAGDRLKLSLANPTAGTIIANWILRLTPA
jgi:hypothetical protein